jgi:SAM-dependent methyltransferase
MKQHAHHQHGHHHNGHHGGPGFANAKEWAKVFDDPARDEWQRPNEVIAALGLTSNMTVADLGAGTGYFSVRLARALPDGAVIATDVEPDMVTHLQQRAAEAGLTNLRAQRATPASAGLAPRSVDRVLIVNVWHHIDDRVSYARDLAASLKPGGRIVVVDYRKDAADGPPPEMRLEPQRIIDEFQAAGLVALQHSTQLPRQYIVEAREP